MEARVQPDRPNSDEADRPNDGGPPQISPADPYARETHDAGGTYAEADFSLAAQRSQFHREQFEPGPSHYTPGHDERRSGFADADPYEPPGGQSTGK
jgi:hypothetical protein